MRASREAILNDDLLVSLFINLTSVVVVKLYIIFCKSIVLGSASGGG